MPTFDELIDLLVAGNDPPVGYVGRYTEVADGAVVRERRIWRLRDLVRVEDGTGCVLMVAGDRRCWYLGHEDGPRDFGSVPPESEGLLLDPRQYWTSWLSENRGLVASTLRPAEHEGRPAWSFTAPEVKGHCPIVTVDAELGLLVRIATEDGAHAETWTDLEVLPGLEPGFFVRTPADLAQEPPPGATARWDDATELPELEQRFRILDAIVRALADPHATLDLLLGSDDVDGAVEALRARFGFDETAARAVTELQLRRMPSGERHPIVAERDHLAARLEDARRRGALEAEGDDRDGQALRGRRTAT